MEIRATSQVEATTLAALEMAEAAMVTASGMGAIFVAVMSLLQKGDHVVAQRNVYASAATLFGELLPRWGIECTFVDRDADFAAALRPNTKLIYAETPANPLMGLTDLRALSEIARPRGITTMVDNTFATPINQRPLKLGIDVVVHSATKYLSGHHDVMAGVMIGSKEFIDRCHSGSRLWLGGAGSVRCLVAPARFCLRWNAGEVDRHNRNALAVARFLEAHPKIERANYPGLESHPQRRARTSRQMSGFTGMLSVELRGGYAAAVEFIQAVKLGRYAASLGGFATLLVHPAAMWAESLTSEQRAAMGVSDSLVRISIGSGRRARFDCGFHTSTGTNRAVTNDAFQIRRAGVSDAATIGLHRATMFREMGQVPAELFEDLRVRSELWTAEALAAGEYVGWLATLADSAEIIAGAGVQLRRVPPHPVPRGAGSVALAKGRHAILLNVFTEPDWRRCGLGARLVNEIIAWARSEKLDRLILHASADGRALYERLGFVGTNEMRYAGDLSALPNE